MTEQQPHADRVYPSQERLRELFDYDPETGICVWRHRENPKPSNWNSRFEGKEVGSLSFYGYKETSIDGDCYHLHVLIVIWMTGEVPENDTDHRDTVKINNTWENLRPATRSQNLANHLVRRDSRSKLKGCHARRRDPGMFDAYIRREGKKVHLGSYDCPAAAHFRYVVEAFQIYGDYGRSS